MDLTLNEGYRKKGIPEDHYCGVKLCSKANLSLRAAPCFVGQVVTGRSVALCSLKKAILREISQVNDSLIVLLRQNYECTQRSSCRDGSRGRVQGVCTPPPPLR